MAARGPLASSEVANFTEDASGVVVGGVEPDCPFSQCGSAGWSCRFGTLDVDLAEARQLVVSGLRAI